MVYDVRLCRKLTQRLAQDRAATRQEYTVRDLNLTPMALSLATHLLLFPHQ